jgi:hypothetical protein
MLIFSVSFQSYHILSAEIVYSVMLGSADAQQFDARRMDYGYMNDVGDGRISKPVSGHHVHILPQQRPVLQEAG